MKIGEFAKRTGVTVKTLLHYDKKGLLIPSIKTDVGYRIYTDDDILRLQQIVTLKFIGLSLKEIKQLLDEDDGNVKSLINIQRIALEEKKNHLELAIDVLKNAEVKLEQKGFLEIDELIEITKTMDMQVKVKEQYKTVENLRQRGNLHSYNINKTDWTNWCFDQMEIPKRTKILELGCGTGELWFKNRDKIDKSWDITLSDQSEAMIKKTKEKLEKLNYNYNFNYKTVDVQDIPYRDESFDIVIARHMLYLIPDIEKALSEIRRILVKGGILYLTTNSCDAMNELNELIDKYDKSIGLGNNGMCERFDCENGIILLNKYFSDIKSNVLNGKIIIDESEPIVSYKTSTIKGSKILVGEKRQNFKEYLDKYFKKNKNISISTKACIFQSKK